MADAAQVPSRTGNQDPRVNLHTMRSRQLGKAVCSWNYTKLRHAFRDETSEAWPKFNGARTERLADDTTVRALNGKFAGRGN